MRGRGLVRGQHKDGLFGPLMSRRASSPRGLHVDPVIGRSPSSDIVIDEPYVSASRTSLYYPGTCSGT